jgi:Putative amidoligase enzyme.
MRFQSNNGRFGAEVRFTFQRTNSGLANERVRLTRGSMLWPGSVEDRALLQQGIDAVLARVALPRRRVNTEATIDQIVAVLNQVTGGDFRIVNRYRATRRRHVRRRMRVYGSTPTARRHVVHEYSYKPNARFQFGGGEGAEQRAFFGVELEIDQRCGGPLDVRDVPDVAHPLFYCKRDGSLNDGVELVSHPGSRSWWTEQRGAIEVMMQRLSQMGWRSHEVRTCGMHVHVSRDAFENSMHIYRFLHLVYRFPELALLVSQRQRHQMNQWATLRYNKKPSLKSKAQLQLKGREWDQADNAGHYDGVNQTEHTFELRIFNGTLNPKRFYKNLQYAWAALAFTADTMNLRHITAARFFKWVMEHSAQYPDLADFFTENAGHAALSETRAAA